MSKEPTSRNQQVDALFYEADECYVKQVKKSLIANIKEVMSKKRAARKVLANIEREEAELRLKVKHELEL